MGERATLVKFGARQHIIELQDTGLLYMNNLPRIWDIEDEELRGDPFDSVSEIARGAGGSLSTPAGTPLPFTMSKWTIRIHPYSPETINVFCMYALRPSVGSWPIDTKNLRFGDTALVFLDPQAFVDRIEVALRQQGVRGEAGLVEYVPNDYEGEVGPFRKLQTFQYQSEWRLTCYGGPGGPRRLAIGDINDICKMMASDVINQRVRIGSDGRIMVDV